MSEQKPERAEASRRDFIATAGALAAIGALPTAAAASPLRFNVSQDEAKPDEAELVQKEASKPTITTETIAEAEKLVGVEFTEKEREQIVSGINDEVERYAARRGHPYPNGLAPAQTFDCRLPGMTVSTNGRFAASNDDPGPLPANDEDIAFAPVTSLSKWIQWGKLTSRQLTQLYFDRLETFGPKLECVVTLTKDRAMRQASRADEELAAGRYRGPLHGIPWGGKDLLDTAGIRTSWGAMPYKDRVPEVDAAVVKKLDDAGAVLIAKLTLGALAYGDIWFGGRTNNPFNLQQGSSGSSAGSAAATTAGLVGFTLGTETLGSIVSPCMRCGATGLRPTFGRVPRTGAMALCWSLDKIGPICRTAEDTILVLQAISGPDPGDPSSVNMPLSFDANRPLRDLTVGYSPAWFDGRRVSEHDKKTLELARELGVNLVQIELPELPYGTLMTILLVEAAAAFEEITLDNTDDLMKWQSPQAWPNTFRTQRFTPAIEYVQAERFRRDVMHMMAKTMEPLDAIIAPSFAGSLLLITNNTGHPSLTIRNGFRDNGTPNGITLIGKLFGEGDLCRLGMALEKELGVWDVRPELKKA